MSDTDDLEGVIKTKKIVESADAIPCCPNIEIEKQKKQQGELYGRLIVGNEAFEPGDWMASFGQFIDNYGRILYFHLTSLILIENSDNTINSLLHNLDKIIDYINTGKDYIDNGKEKEHSRDFMKFYDHCNLAATQRKTYNETKTGAAETTKRIVAENMADYNKDITAQLIGLISLFTALSFVIFGGINMLGSLFTRVENLHLAKTAFVGFVWLLCMGDIFAVFVKFICRIIDKVIILKWYLLIINLVPVGGIALILFVLR